jgi:hypothetical protein
MTGEVTIDTIDIWTQFGAFLLKGSYNGLMQPPRRKVSLSNNWPEQNGLEIDLAAPKYEAKEADLSFILSAYSEAEWWTRYNAFFTLLKLGGERSLFVAALNKTFAVHYKEVSSYEQLTKVTGTNQVIARYTVKFGIANPVF